jgi:hypothetical protein
LRELVDRALDWLFQQAMRLGRAALNALGMGSSQAAPPGAAGEQAHVNVEFEMNGQTHHVYADQNGSLMIASTPRRVDKVGELSALVDRWKSVPPDAEREQFAAIDAIIEYIFRHPQLAYILDLFGQQGFDDKYFKPGPHARQGVPSSSATSYTSEEREAVKVIGMESGCHHCGTKEPGLKDGYFVPDHQPVTALNVERKPQLLYPHCKSCADLQGLAAMGLINRGLLYRSHSLT